MCARACVCVRCNCHNEWYTPRPATVPSLFPVRRPCTRYLFVSVCFYYFFIVIFPFRSNYYHICICIQKRSNLRTSMRAVPQNFRRNIVFNIALNYCASVRVHTTIYVCTPPSWGRIVCASLYVYVLLLLYTYVTLKDAR